MFIMLLISILPVVVFSFVIPDNYYSTSKKKKMYRALELFKKKLLNKNQQKNNL